MAFFNNDHLNPKSNKALIDAAALLIFLWLTFGGRISKWSHYTWNEVKNRISKSSASQSDTISQHFMLTQGRLIKPRNLMPQIKIISASSPTTIGNVATIEVKIKNMGGDTLTIEKMVLLVHPDYCDHIQPELPFSLSGGESKTFKLFAKSNRPQENIQDTIFIESNDPDSSRVYVPIVYDIFKEYEEVSSLKTLRHPTKKRQKSAVEIPKNYPPNKKVYLPEIGIYLSWNKDKIEAWYKKKHPTCDMYSEEGRTVFTFWDLSKAPRLKGAAIRKIEITFDNLRGKIQPVTIEILLLTPGPLRLLQEAWQEIYSDCVIKYGEPLYESYYSDQFIFDCRRRLGNSWKLFIRYIPESYEGGFYFWERILLVYNRTGLYDIK